MAKEVGINRDRDRLETFSLIHDNPSYDYVTDDDPDITGCDDRDNQIAKNPIVALIGP